MDLRPLRKTRSLADQIVEVLLERISSGELKAGDQLPTEQQLSEAFEVSRAVVREAVARLRQQGMVYSQQGKGVFVNETGADAPVSLAGQVSLTQLAQFRLAIEPIAASLAARQHNSTTLSEIEKAVDAIGEATTGDYATAAAADFAFHVAIARASGNPLFLRNLEAIWVEMSALLQTAHGNTRRVTGSPTAVQREHAEICNAISAGDAASARSAMELHLRRAAARLSLKVDLF